MRCTARPYGEVVIELYGETGPDGMIMDFKEMEEKCWEVLSRVDHHDLNLLFERPTSENITSWIWIEKVAAHHEGPVSRGTRQVVRRRSMT